MIQARDVIKDYYACNKSVRILDKADFTVEEGAFVALVGRSGTGKTTVLNLLGGLDKPTSGEIIFENRHIEVMCDAELSSFRNKTIGFVFQSYYLRPMLTALENVLAPLLFDSISLSEARQRGREALDEVGLAGYGRTPVRQLSGGQRQRVAIARAIVNRPRLLLADEPTGNLDTSTSLDIFSLLMACNEKRGTTVVVVTHDPLVEKFHIPMVTIEQGKVLPFIGKI
ncbi:MAG: ABC transporter ATP-binding protein [bacterium]|nr:ABC transporter ATP-binding protein [Candidatus Sumerlaeota bacterium]